MGNAVFTKEALKKLDEAIIGGARSVSIGEKSITFHSLDELLKLRNQIARFLSGEDPIKISVPIVTKGLWE